MWNFNKILGISSLSIVSFKKDKEKIFFHLKPRRKTAFCPNCKYRSKYLHSFLSKRIIKHGLILGKFCLIVFSPRRFFCLRCKKVFTERLSIVEKYQRATNKHKKEVIFNLSEKSFLSGKRFFKSSYHTQRRWLKQIIANKIFNFSKEEKENTPFVLGIDEVSFSGKEMLTTIGNITKKRLKGILTSKRKSDLRKILKNLSPKTKSLIKEVVIDMCFLYKKTVEETLPNTKIVVDKFHLIYDANRRIEDERLFLQQIYKTKISKYPLIKPKEKITEKERIILENIFKQYPEIKLFYLTKERLRDLYQQKTKEKAEENLRLIISYLKSSDHGELIKWGRTLFNFKDQILNYWNSYSTNGFMEGINNKIKLTKRISYGFKNKQVFIYKVMLSVLITTILLPQFLT